MSIAPKILVYGYGNPGRQDDGLGIALAEIIEKWTREAKVTGVETDSNYQLNIEDAYRIAGFDAVFFADATKEEVDKYAFTPLEPSPAVEFTMHSVSPAFILDLCRGMYRKQPSSFLLHIKGYEWGFMEHMTPEAARNLEAAAAFLKGQILAYIGKPQTGMAE